MADLSTREPLAMENSKRERKPLSARAIEAMRPGDKARVDTGENAGLRVICGKKGGRVFIYRYRSPETGRLTQIRLGSYPRMSLAQARVALHRHKELRASGVCPKAEMVRQKVREQEATALSQKQVEDEAFTVKELVDLYLAEVIEDRVVVDKATGAHRRLSGARKPKGQAEVRRTLYHDAVRVLGDMQASAVTRKDIVDMVKEILDRGANVQAGSVLRELIAAYEYAIGIGRLDVDFANPALQARQGLGLAKVRLTSRKGRRVLSDKELREVLAWLPGSGFSATQKKVIWFTLWTGARTGEVCAARWEDIDLDAATWHIRESKTQVERHVQLPRQAVDFLRQLKLTTSIYLFPSIRTGDPILQKSLSETKWALKNPDKVTGGRSFKAHQLWLTSIPDWSPHDLRRTVRTGLARLGCRNEVGEAILGHTRRGIEGTYDLHSYERECREWLQRWADHLESLAAPASGVTTRE